MFTHRICAPPPPATIDPSKKMLDSVAATAAAIKPGQQPLPRLQITKANDLHTQIYQRTIVVRNYKLCAGTVKSTLSLPDAFCSPSDEGRELVITISRSKFPNRPMEIVLDGVRSHWTSYKCAIRRSEDEIDDLEFAEIKFVRATNGSGSQVSGLFKDQLRDDLYMRLTICVSNPVESVASSPVLNPQPAQISKLFMKETHSDFRIICAYGSEEEQHIPVHRNILSVASPYFRAMLQPETAEAKSGQVTLTVIPYKALVEILHCIYHGERSANFGSVCLELMFAADFLEMLALRDYAASWLARNLTKENAFRVLHAALQLGLNRLARQACEFVKANVPEEESKAKLVELQKQCPELIVHLIALM